MSTDDDDKLSRAINCKRNFSCFEALFDVIADHALHKDFESITCDEFCKLGSDEELERSIKEDDAIKVCPILAKVFEELKEYL